MPAAVIGSAIGSVGQIGASLIGSSAAGADRDAANAAVQKAVDLITSTGAPPDMAKQIFLEQFQQQGILTPEMEQNINATFEKIAPQTTGRDAQTKALQQLQGLSSTGLNAQDRLAFSQAQQDAARQNTAQQNAIMQNMAARGQAGGGAELASRLQASQGGANQLANSANQVAAEAAARSLQAIGAAGNLGGQLQGQDTALAGQNASIANEQQRFNVQNQLAQQQRNVASQNAAQAANLQNKQNIANANTGQTNQELERQRAGQMQTWQAQLGLNQDKANAYQGQAANDRYNAKQTQDTWNGIGSAIGKIGGGIGSFAGGGSGGGNSLSTPTSDGLSSGGSQDVAGGFSFAPAMLYKGGMSYKDGGPVDGEATVKGDSPKNDTVEAMLSPGELVVPRSALASQDATADFINKRLGFNLRAGK